MRSTTCFNCSDRERATFELGIKLASFFHQYLGAPINLGNVDSMERAMREGILNQPFVLDAEITLDREEIERSVSEFGYCSISERMMAGRITIEYKGFEAVGELHWTEELRYPLMRVVAVGPRCSENDRATGQ
ncbi:MAG: dihydroneopterin aldolase family protein [Thermoplasmata archaeon]|nr:dihydroneopterin aldolase family protein [Thermoplasmata archaeon]